MSSTRKIKFPRRHSLGSLYRAPADQPESWELLRIPQGLITSPENQPISWDWLDEARGIVEVPEGSKLKLKVGASALDHLEALTRLDPDALHTVDMSRTPASDQHVRHLSNLSGLKVLELAYTAVSNNVLYLTFHMEQLHTLGLTNTGIANSGLSDIGCLSGLKELWLNGTLIDDDGAAHLSELQELVLLGLSSTKLSDAGLEILSRIPGLIRLYMFNTKISEQGAASLRKQVPGCRVKWRRPAQVRPEYVNADDALLSLANAIDSVGDDPFADQVDLNCLDDQVFWKIVEQLDWSEQGDDDKVIEPCVSTLAELSPSEIQAFEETLAAKLHALDGERFARHIGREAYRGRNHHFSKNWFLKVRCCAVANGREIYENILSDPQEMPKDLEFAAILSIPRLAWERKTGDEFDYAAALSKETFSNVNGWFGIAG